MIARRDMLIASACVAAACAAAALKPRRYLSLLGPQHLDHIVPRTVEDWQSQDVSDQFAPDSKDSLQAILYGETIGRIYHQATSDSSIMMLLAHGDIQSNELQLHRPEVCYPAFGFEIISSVSVELPLDTRVQLPVRSLVAKSGDQRQTVIYWTRLGEYLPLTGNEQRFDRVRLALSGYVADGLLARFSISGVDPLLGAKALGEFIRALIKSVPATGLAALIGTSLARELVLLDAR